MSIVEKYQNGKSNSGCRKDNIGHDTLNFKKIESKSKSYNVSDVNKSKISKNSKLAQINNKSTMKKITSSHKFDLVDDDTIERIEQSNFTKKSKGNKSLYCAKCNQQMVIYSGLGGPGGTDEKFYVCNTCGKMDKCFEDISDNQTQFGNDASESQISYCNTSGNSSTPVRVKGKYSGRHDKQLISHTSDYNKTQKYTSLNEMNQILYHYNGRKPGPAFINRGAEIFYSIQQTGCIKRGKPRRGAMAVCLNKACKEGGVEWCADDLASMFKVSVTDISRQEKAIDERMQTQKSTGYVSQNWDLETTIKSIRDTNFELLELPDEYKDFIWMLVYFTVKKDISQTSVEKTKVAGAIYILSISCDDVTITKDDIERECKVSKSTFMRYFTEIKTFLNCNDKEKSRKQLMHIFKKYNISLNNIIDESSESDESGESEEHE